MGCGGGGKVVSILAFYSDNLNLNPAEFLCTALRKGENKLRRGRSFFNIKKPFKTDLPVCGNKRS